MLALAAEKLVFKNVNDEKDRIQRDFGGAKIFFKKSSGRKWGLGGDIVNPRRAAWFDRIAG